MVAVETSDAMHDRQTSNAKPYAVSAIQSFEGTQWLM